MNKKIIILSRISTSVQHIESQTNDLVNEAIRLGYPKSKHIIIEGVESAIKLQEFERQTLNKMKYYIEHDKDVDCVICWEPSRLSRQQKTLYSIRDYLIDHKIQLYIINPYMRLFNDDRTQIDTTASIVFSVFSTLAENEMMIKKERFMRAKNELTKQGKKSAGSVIFGYMKDKDKKCVPHPLHSKIISDLFNHYITHEDTSLHETYQYASSKWPELFPTVEYKKAQHKIRHFFDTTLYSTGNWCYPPLISQETMDKVKEKMAGARCQARYNSKLELLGRGKVRCKHCGNIMTGCGGNVNAYCCSTDKLHSLQINFKALDWLIWEEVKVAANIASTIDNSTKVIEVSNQIKEKNNILSQLNIYIGTLRDKQDKLVALYLDDKIAKDIYDKRYESLNDELTIKEKELESVQTQINELNSVLHQDNIIDDKPINFDTITNFDSKLELVRRYVKDILVEKKEDGSISIEFSWLQSLVLPRCTYTYTSKGGRKKIFRNNEDGTTDLIYK